MGNKKKIENAMVDDDQLHDAHAFLTKIACTDFNENVDDPFKDLPCDDKPIFAIADVVKVINEQAKDSRLKPRLEAMMQEGNMRSLASINDAILEQLIPLADKFPNFSDVVLHYRKALLLASLSRPAIVYLPPLLIVGDPGIGKTRFLRELAKVLSVDFFQIDMSTTSAGFVLAGSSTSWADGKPGFVSDSLRQSKVANPILLIDEIDKVSSGNYDPMGCFYTLLERDTARTFKDEALTIAMDCSDINWVASANYVEAIPAPIRSRMTVFNVKAPTREQMPTIAQSVYKDLLAENDWGKRFSQTLSMDILNKLSVASPREMKRILTSAASEAVFKRRHKQGEKLHIMADDIAMVEDEAKDKRIGFL